MNLWLRLLWVLIGQRCLGGSSLLDDLRLSFHVMPHDLDLQMHMNNGRYLTLMDLGRIALMKRTGLLSELRRLRGFGVAGGIVVHFIRPLSLFQQVNLHTRVVSWDEKWIYLEQRFIRGDTLHAHAFVRVLLCEPRGKIPTARVLQLLDAEHLDPPGPVPAGFDSP